MVYAAATLSLAILEMLVRLPLREVPTDFVSIHLAIPEDMPIEEVNPHDLPGWNAIDRIASRAYGDAWLTAQRTCILRVPAVAVPDERNVLLNPLHPLFARITADAPQPLLWDRRLFQRDSG